MEIIDRGLSFVSSKLMTRDINGITTLYFHHEGGNGGVEQIHEGHLQDGWSGCGYNWVVRKNGIVEKGRDIKYIPAGVQDHNTHSVHICFEGNFMNDYITPEQENSGKELIDYVKGIIPSVSIFIGHREVMATDCPADSKVGGHFPLDELKAYAYGYSVKPSNVSISNIKESVTMSCIKIGENSQRVKILQLLLSGEGYPLSCDGSFGNLTDGAVKQFQRNNSLTVDGVVGINTVTKLLDNAKSILIHE